MTATIPAYGTAGAYSPDNLLVNGPVGHDAQAVTVLSGQNLKRGAVLGRQTVDEVPATGTAGGANTGDGTVTGVARGGADLEPGTYTARCVRAEADKGDLEITSPRGVVIGTAITGTAFTSSHLSLTVNDGTTDFAVGDLFTIEVTGSGKYTLAAAAATDGSHRPERILADDCDATGGGRTVPAYRAGGFNERALIFGTGLTAAAAKAALEARNIYLYESVGG